MKRCKKKKNVNKVTKAVKREVEDVIRKVKPFDKPFRACTKEMSRRHIYKVCFRRHSPWRRQWRIECANCNLPSCSNPMCMFESSWLIKNYLMYRYMQQCKQVWGWCFMVSLYAHFVVQCVGRHRFFGYLCIIHTSIVINNSLQYKTLSAKICLFNWNNNLKDFFIYLFLNK